MERKAHITDERTGIGYTLCGDYYLPDLVLPEEKAYELGRFGRAKYRHLQNCHRVLLTTLRTSGTLSEYLAQRRCDLRGNLLPSGKAVCRA